MNENTTAPVDLDETPDLTPRRRKPPRRIGARCGTPAGALIHVRAGEKACPACAKARNEYMRAYRAGKKTVAGTRVSNELLIKLLRAAPESLREEAVGELTLSLLLEWDVL